MGKSYLAVYSPISISFNNVFVDVFLFCLYASQTKSSLALNELRSAFDHDLSLFRGEIDGTFY